MVHGGYYNPEKDWGAHPLSASPPDRRAMRESWQRVMMADYGVTDEEFEEYRNKVQSAAQTDEHLNMEELPPFDVHAKCIKCGHEIAEPEPVPQPTVDPAKPGPAKPKPPAKKEEAAAPPKGPMAMPVKAPPPTVEYCNGNDCPWGEETEGLGEHMHAFCDVCGYEWLSRPLDWKG